MPDKRIGGIKRRKVKKRFMACTQCSGTSFEVFHEELIHDSTQDELTGFYFDLGACGTTQIRCLGCGAISKLKAIFKKEE